MISIDEISKASSLFSKELNAPILRKTMIRFLLLECKHNLNILRLASNNAGQYSKSRLELFSKLEVDKIEIFLANKSLHKSIIGKVKEAMASADEETISNDLLENALLKIKILKVISTLGPCDNLKKFKLKERSNNLEKKLLEIIDSNSKYLDYR